MTRFVIAPGVALQLAETRARVPDRHQLLAPASIRSQLLSTLYAEVRDGRLAKTEAERRLDHVRALRLRLLGDRVLQSVAWTIADELGLPDTRDAEYLALTRLQADAFVSLDPGWARVASAVVPTAPVAALEAQQPPRGSA